MKELEEKIIAEGKVYPGRILKVGAFLNHQLDVDFINRLGKEFYELYKSEKITKILTIEASGIGIACLTAQYFNVPVLFAKKTKSKNLGNDCYICQVHSYTKGTDTDIMIEKQFLSANDRILIIDDFLANGCALDGLTGLCRMAGAEVVGAGIVIEKAFQEGGKRLRDSGLRIESLCRIADMDPENGITFLP